MNKLILKFQTIMFVFFSSQAFALNIFLTGGIGANYVEDYNTLLYQFKPSSFNLTPYVGFGFETNVVDQLPLGIGLRYLYNDTNGDVDPNINVNTRYDNNVHNILTTLETNVDFYQAESVRLTPGIRLGAGVNAYRMQLTADNVGGLGTKIDPERKWSYTPAGFVGLYLKKTRPGYSVLGSLDYFYLGRQSSERQSRTFPSNNMLQKATFNNHNIVFTITYSIKGIV